MIAVYLSINGFKLLQCSENKHSSLAHARLSLAQHIHTQNGLWDAFVLHCNEEMDRKGGQKDGFIQRKNKWLKVC